MTVVDLYTIQIISGPGATFAVSESGAYKFTDLPALMTETEENLTDLLPPGYRARIRRWDHPDEEEGTPR